MKNVLLEIDQKTQNGMSYIPDQNQRVALMTFRLRHNTLIIDHTEINESHQGKGLGKDLLLRLVEFSKENNYKILPLCTYAYGLFKKDLSIRGVLKETIRFDQ